MKDFRKNAYYRRFWMLYGIFLTLALLWEDRSFWPGILYAALLAGAAVATEYFVGRGKKMKE